MVADATLVSLAAVRQAAKNLMLVRALRDSADFDAEWYADAVGRELGLLATQADADAERLAGELAALSSRRGAPAHGGDYRAKDARKLRRRRRVLRDLARELRELSGDDATVTGIIADARIRALDEITATAASVPGVGRAKPAKGIARSRALQALREELSDYAD